MCRHTLVKERGLKQARIPVAAAYQLLKTAAPPAPWVQLDWHGLQSPHLRPQPPSMTPTKHSQPQRPPPPQATAHTCGGPPSSPAAAAAAAGTWWRSPSAAGSGLAGAAGSGSACSQEPPGGPAPAAHPAPGPSSAGPPPAERMLQVDHVRTGERRATAAYTASAEEKLASPEQQHMQQSTQFQLIQPLSSVMQHRIPACPSGERPTSYAPSAHAGQQIHA